MDKKNEKLNVEVFDYSTIPKFMQEHGRFCLWKLVMKPSKVKPDKIPYRINGKRADTTNPQHYSSFEDTVEAFAKGGYAGIGIECFEPLRLVDVDDCIVNGKLDARGQDIVDTLDSYTELSSSGNGIHIFILADGFTYNSERYYINNRNTHVEVYAPDVTGKFLTLTGKAIHGAEVNERSEQLQSVLDKYMKSPDADVTAPTVNAPGSFLSDESVYTKASKSKQAEKFNESEFIELVTKQSEKDLNRQLRDSHKELEQAKCRIAKLDTIVQRLYEDNLDGKISGERSARMSATYDTEQKQLVQRQAELQEFIDKSKEQTSNVDSFLKVVRKYTDITELTAEIIRSFVERIDVYKPEKVPGTRTKKQTICIHWNFIGAVDIPAEHEKTT